MIDDSKKSKYLKALKRRAKHLGDRIKDNPDLSFDKSEVAALRWALSKLDVKPEPCGYCGRIHANGDRG